MAVDPPTSEHATLMPVTPVGVVSRLLAALAAHPVGADYSAVTEPYRSARREHFFRELVLELQELGGERPRADDLDLQDFARRLVAAEHELLGGADDLKAEYLRRYLSSAVREARVDATWKDLFLRYLRLCTGCHLLVLNRFFDTQRGLSARDRFELPHPTDRAPLTAKLLTPLLPGGFDPILLSAVLADLEAFGLTRMWGSRPTAEVGWSITDNGIRFMSFVTEPTT